MLHPCRYDVAYMIIGAQKESNTGNHRISGNAFAYQRPDIVYLQGRPFGARLFHGEDRQRHGVFHAADDPAPRHDLSLRSVQKRRQAPSDTEAVLFLRSALYLRRRSSCFLAVHRTVLHI